MVLVYLDVQPDECTVNGNHECRWTTGVLPVTNEEQAGNHNPVVEPHLRTDDQRTIGMSHYTMNHGNTNKECNATPEPFRHKIHGRVQWCSVENIPERVTDPKSPQCCEYTKNDDSGGIDWL